MLSRQVFDLGSEQKTKIREVSSKGDVRLLQLPSLPAAENGQPVADDKRGYIVQGSIDKQVCIVSNELQSLRPFRNTSGSNSQKDGAGSSGENVPTEPAQQGEPDVVGSDRSLCAPSGIKWQLNCWNTEEVKLQEDNTKELQYEAIRASWAENSVGRNTNGAVSRLLYLGKGDEAEARMKQEGMSDEQTAKMNKRFEWIQTAKTNMSSNSIGIGNSYLEEVASDDEKLVLDVQLEDRQRVMLERIGIVEVDKEQRRVARAAAKDERAKELKDLVQSVIENRAISIKQQQERKREFTALQTQSA
ncbi:hypothetical protein BBJ29_003182 [Phytophthora kernoviae]|uniref:Uncharacterized protein n=1 Tax=Phytophthora kernoviae TaxID=325452 RepID=A0A3F2RQC2_9STRA|nr:hypothetical protein BBJ29_003182 [Phytophthora kernoviae]RLN62143.1 hypothetical protein BBP00_00004958 [Phytophthora kernoviae]